MIMRTIDGVTPDIEKADFVAENATVTGNVTLHSGTSVWYSAVLRGDAGPIVIGENSNVQDCACLHTDAGRAVTLGRGVSVGHSAVVHGCTVEDDVLIGIHATLLNGCVIGKGSIVAAGALVTEGAIIPPGSLVVGVPGKVLRPVSEAQREGIRQNAVHYRELAALYAGQQC